MIVMKFGGTSLQDAERIDRAVEIVGRHQSKQPVVVVSAIGGCTRELLAIGEVALHEGPEPAGVQLARLVDRHRSIAADLRLKAKVHSEVTHTMARYATDLEQFVSGVALLKQLTPRTQDAMIAYGERWSTLLFTAAARATGLDAELVDAATVMITDDRFRAARPDTGEMERRARERMLPLVQRNRIPVVAGFIGATRDGVPTTLGMEASDYSASLLGAALDATEIQIWTDVVGMLTTGNAGVDDVMCIRTLSFGEAAEMSFFGAKVLHPRTIEPAVAKNIPVRIRHSLSPEGDGTTIHAQPPPSQPIVKSIAVKEDIRLLSVRPREPEAAHRTVWLIAEVLDRHEIPVDLMAMSGNRALLAVAGRGAPEHLESDLAGTHDVTRDERCAIVSLIGDDVLRAPDVSLRATRALQPIPLRLACPGPSDTSVSFVIADRDAGDAVVKLHDEFFRREGLPDMFVPVRAESGS